MTDKTLVPQLFGQALKKCREAKKLSRAELARKIGHQHSRIAKLENGGSDLQLSSLLALTRALGVTPGELLDEMDAEYRRILAKQEESDSQDLA